MTSVRDGKGIYFLALALLGNRINAESYIDSKFIYHILEYKIYKFLELVWQKFQSQSLPINKKYKFNFGDFI